MGNEQKPKAQVIPMPTPAEIKTFIMIAQTKLNLFRNKKLEIIKKKKNEIAISLKENNLDVAKAKMDSLIREEDYITAYDILGPLLEILKERVTYIISSNECPPDLRAQLDSVIYASTRLEFEELYKLRDLIMRKYGSAYIQKAENNVDKLVNINLVEKLKIKPASDPLLIIRLKQLCKEKKIPFEFPSEITSDIPSDIGNPFGGPGFGGGDFNPYASAQGPNPYGPPQGGPNPYGPPQGGNNPFGSQQGGNNPFASQQGDNNPYGPPQGGNNPFGPGSNDNNNNPFASSQGGNNNNPFGPGNSQIGQNQNNNMNDNPYNSMNKNNNNNNNNENILGGPTILKTQNPNSSINNNPNEPPKSDNDNPFANQSNNNSSNPFGNDNSNPFNNSKSDSNSNPYGNNSNNNMDNPFEKKDDGGFPKIDNEDSNPYA